MLSIDSTRHDPQEISLKATWWKRRSSNASTSLVGVRDNKSVKVEANTKTPQRAAVPGSPPLLVEIWYTMRWNVTRRLIRMWNQCSR